MNRKQLLMLIVAAVIIGGLGLISLRRQNASWQGGNTSASGVLLGAFPVNDVAQIVIKQAQNELNLVRGETRGEVTWQVRERNNYPANFNEISEVIRKLSELKPVQTVKVGPSQLGRLELLPPDKGTNGGTLLELKDKSGKVIKSILVGKKHMRNSGDDSPMGMGGGWPDGRFVLVQNTTGSSVYVISDPLANVEPKPESWLNKDFFKVEKLKSIAVALTNNAASWKFSRETETGDLKLADKKEGEDPDSNKVVSLVNALSFPSFNDVVPADTKPETTGLDHPTKVELETIDHFHYEVLIGKSGPNDNYYLALKVSAELPTERTPGKDEKPEDKTKLDKEFKDNLDKQKAKLAQEKACESWVYLVSKWTVESLLKDRAHWMVDKKDATASNGAAAPKTNMDPADQGALPPMPSGDDDKEEPQEK
jgi:hypothetical protein